MISAIVCTYNRASVLRKMLERFFAQTCLGAVDYELIVVDNNSSDHTSKVVEEFRRFPNVRYVFEEHQGLCYARNRGVAEARGEIIALLDDDVVVDEVWLFKLQECVDATQADVVGGRTYLILEKDPPEWFGPYFARLLSEVNLGKSRRIVSDGRGLFGLNLAFRKSIFDTVGPFDEALDRRGHELLGGGDTAKVRQIARAGGRVVYDPDAVVGHMIAADRQEWDYFKRVTLAMGKSFAFAEPYGGLGVRTTRVLQALMEVAYRIGVQLSAPLTRMSPYEQRASLGRLRTKLGLLIERLRRLKGNG